MTLVIKDADPRMIRSHRIEHAHDGKALADHARLMMSAMTPEEVWEEFPIVSQLETVHEIDRRCREFGYYASIGQHPTWNYLFWRLDFPIRNGEVLIADGLTRKGMQELLLSVPSPKPVGNVYFIHAPDVGRVKIGWALDVSDRWQELTKQSPVRLELLAFMEGSRSDEAALHRRFKRFRVFREWFTCDPSLMQYVESLKDTVDA